MEGCEGTGGSGPGAGEEGNGALNSEIKRLVPGTFIGKLKSAAEH